ncbi:MAG: WD40/YVTN/BNR-like repeat-containing protein [Candidatus Acidiferrales bacterium]
MRTSWRVAIFVLWLGLGFSLAASAQTLRPIGPPGGDVQTLASAPGNIQLLYLGTADGHVFGSTDAGLHWQSLSRIGNGKEVVMSILPDSRQPSHLFAATWSMSGVGGGVYRSTDAGRNWQLAGLGGQEARALAQSPSNPELTLAGTLQGVYRTRDDGRHWELISPANNEDLRNFDSLAFDPHDSNIIYAGTYHLPWKTSDGGKNWAPIHTGMVDDSDVMSISVNPTEPSEVFASACSGIYHSINAAENWSKYKGIPFSSRRTHMIRQDPAHPEIVYAATTEGLWKTTDSGAIWKQMTSGTWVVTALVIDPRNTEHLIIGSRRMGILISEDGGRSFRESNDGFRHRGLLDLAVDPVNSAHMLLIFPDEVEPALATRDAGRTWQKLGPGLGTGQLRHVYAAPDGWWATLKSGGLLHYSDAAAKWLPTGTLVETVAVKSPAPARSKSAAKSKSAKTVARTRTVAKTITTKPVINDLSFTSSAWFAASDSGLLVSRDRGTTWTKFSSDAQVAQPVISVRSTSDALHLWALTSHGLVVTADAGKTWSAETVAAPLNHDSRLTQAGDNTFLVTTPAGLYLSSDAGKTWHPAAITDRQIQNVAVIGDDFVASSASNGLFFSEDRGAHWSHLEDPLAWGFLPALATNSADGSIVAASSTEGLFSLDLSRTGIRSAAAPASGTGTRVAGQIDPPRDK